MANRSAPKRAVRNAAPTPWKALEHIGKRRELRAYIENRLPGWGPWMDWAAATVQSRTWDSFLLKNESELELQLRRLVASWLKRVGPRAEEFFLPFAQVRPPFDPRLIDADGATEQQELHDSVHAAPMGSLPFALRALDRMGAMPTPALIGTLGALELVRQKKRRGPPPNFRLQVALDLVFDDLIPFVSSKTFKGRAVGQPVLPDKSQLAGDFDLSAARTKPLELALAAVTALYLSLPNRGDPEYDASEDGSAPDPELLVFPSDATKHACAALTKRIHSRAAKDEPFDVIDAIRAAIPPEPSP